MRSFSKRFGYEPEKSRLQTESLDRTAKVRLWNVLGACLPNNFSGFAHLSEEYRYIWQEFFGWPHSQLEQRESKIHDDLENWFARASWHQALSFLELVYSLELGGNRVMKRAQRDEVQRVLLEEAVAWTFVERYLVPRFEKEQIAEIELALSSSSPSARHHIAGALALMRPGDMGFDPRKVISEAIHACEAEVRHRLGDPNIILSAGIVELSRRATVHSALQEAIKKLYGFAGDIARHAKKGEVSGYVPTEADANFCLVTSSAIVTWVARLQLS